MSLASWVQVGIWVSLCTVCPSLCCQSHSLCHTFVTPPAPLCSCFPSTPARVFLLPFPCCPGSCLPSCAASWARRRGCPGFGLLAGVVLLLWCPGWWRARNSPVLWLPVSISCGNVLFFVPLPSFKNEKFPRIAAGEAGQLGATITYPQLPREWG